jgi:heme-degrading monooxygenase HmoA
MLLAGEGVTRDSYIALTEKMFGNYPMRADQSPEGLILHSAGESEQGWYVYDIWESKEHFQRFVDSTLGPAMHELVGDDGPAPQPQFFEIETLVESD